MRAALMTGYGRPLDIADDLKPREPKAGEVRVSVTHCGLCHSDLFLFEAQGAWDIQLPCILGHEAAGVVDAVGPGVTAVVPGESVVLGTSSSCGRCHWCARGRPTLCVDGQGGSLTRPLPDGTHGIVRQGVEVARGMGIGGFADVALVREMTVTAIPADMPRELACLFGCAVRTGIGAVLNTAAVQEGDTVLVSGLGGVGQSVVLGAVLAGAAQIIVSDPFESRRVLARSIGATAEIDPSTTDVASAVRDLTAGRGVDFAFDASGQQRAVTSGYDALIRGGALVLIGVTADAAVNVPVGSLVIEEKRILGCLLGSSLTHRDVPRFVDLWRAGRLPLEALVTSRRPLDQINAGFDDMRAGTGIRTVIEF